MTERSPTPDVTLRPLRRDEYDAFIARTRVDYAADIARNMQLSDAAARDKADSNIDELLPGGLDTPGHHIYAIERGGVHVGELWLGLQEKHGAVEAFGYDFHVQPELRDAGIGRQAMARAADVARDLGATRMGLHVFGENERAVHLYRSFGFQVASINMVMPLDRD